MTAEVVIMNKEAVAIAADSAITYERPGGKKHFQSANKIFTLSKYHPLGIMVYGNSQFMDVPWEAIIKDYRDRIRDQYFANLRDHAEDFLNFLDTNRAFSPDHIQEEFFEQLISGWFLDLRSRIDETWQDALASSGRLTTPELIQIAKETVKQDLDHWRTEHDLPSSLSPDFKDKLEERYKTNINEIKRSIFGNLLTSTISRWLTQLSLELAAKSFLGGSGLVIVGFGKDDIFPCQDAYYIGAVLADHLLYLHVESQSVDIEYDNRGLISAYAQREMVQSFMEGINPRFRRFITRVVSDVVSELPEHIIDSITNLDEEEAEKLRNEFEAVADEFVKDYRERIEHYSQELHVEPVIKVVSALPKDELAQMAEALVYLTVMKRRISLQEESVAEPIDVAVISKGDGFVWIERKHYFSSDLNIAFQKNYFRHSGDPRGGDEE